MRGQPPNFGFSGAGWGQPQPQQQQQPPPLQQQLLRQPQPQPQFPAAQYMSPNVELQMLNHGRQTSVGFVPGHHNVNFPMQNSNLPIQNYGFQFPQPRNPGFYFQQPPIPNPSLNFSQLPNPGFNNPQPPPYMGSLPHYSTKNPAEGTTRADNSVAKACWTKKPVEGTTRTDNAVAKASSTKKPTEGTTGMDNAVAKASSTKKPTEGTTGMDNAVAKVSLAKNPAEGTTRTDNAVAKASSAKNPEEGTTGTENAVAKASSTKREDIMRINNAVAKAHNDLLVTKENITAWKVLQSALSILQVDSWDSFGFRLQQIDALHRLMLIEGKINSFIHCFVGVRRIATLYELEMAICKNEGVKQFEELRLGPFLCHPLVLHYFSLSSEVTEVFNIKNEEIVSFLSEFMDADVCKNKNITVEDFLDFISRKRSVTNREMLGIRVQNLGYALFYY